MRSILVLALTSVLFSGCSKSSSKADSPRSFGDSDYQTLATLNDQQNALYDAAKEAFPVVLPNSRSAVSPQPSPKEKIMETIKNTNCVSFNLPLPPMTRQTWAASWIVREGTGAAPACSIEIFHDWTFDSQTRTLNVYKTYKPKNAEVQVFSPVGQIITTGQFKAQQTGDTTAVTGSLYIRVEASNTIYEANVTTSQSYVNSVGGGRLDIAVSRGVPAVTASLRWNAEYSDPPFFQYFFNEQEVTRKEFQDVLSSYNLEEIAVQTSRIRF